MTTQDNAFRAIGTGNPHVNFFAIPGDDTQPAPIWGFLTRDNRFGVGGSFSGFVYGVEGHGGHPDDQGKAGPNYNAYSSHAGVFGTGADVTGVAGTSITGVGVYGQSGEDPNSLIPQIVPSPGVFGANNNGSGVVGWSANAIGSYGMSYSHSGVVGQSVMSEGVVGVSDQSVGVQGFSGGGAGVVGMTSNPASVAGGFFGNVGITGNLQVVGLKSAVVPFPDGSRRALYCMESPEVWFEDFGSAKLARGRALVKLDSNFAKVIKRGDYRVFVTPEGNCHGLYVRHKSANKFEVREVMGGKSSIPFSYRIVGRRKDIKQQRRFAKVDMGLPLPTRPPNEFKFGAIALRSSSFQS